MNVVIDDSVDIRVKSIDAFNKIFFNKMRNKKQILIAIENSKDGKLNMVELNSFENFNKYFYKKNSKVFLFVINEGDVGKTLKIVSNINEIIDLKYQSIDLLRKHAMRSIKDLSNLKNELG